MNTKEFFQHVWREGEGLVNLVLPNSTGAPTRNFWFNYPEQLDEIVNFVSGNEGRDVWFSPSLFKSETRSVETAKTMGVAGADADTCEPNNFRVRPTLVINTSPGRYQVYWALDAQHDAKEVKNLNRRIAQVHKDEGCDTAYVNTAKLMRVPGTSNSKHVGSAVIVGDFEDYAETFTLSELSEIYPSSEIPDVEEVGPLQGMPDDLPAYIGANRVRLLNEIPNSASMQELLFGTYNEGKRSEARYKLLGLLIDEGFSDVDVMTLAWNAPTNKYNGEDSRGYNGLWAEIQKIKASNAVGTSVGEIIEQEKFAESAVDFLRDDEERCIADEFGFIDRWVKWAGQKTDAPYQFHEAAAMALLSTLYSQFGHAVPQFGDLKLNIWFMVLGRSTKDRKSTSRSYLLKALRALADDEYTYTTPDDVTSGGLGVYLSDRPHKSTLFARDEVQGFFKEVLGQSYMTGTLESLTKLYDGESSGRLRASGDKKVQLAVPVSFIMFMMGIQTETAETLTPKDYRSGFLTRFIYVFGEREPGFQPRRLTQQSEEEQAKDTEFEDMMNELRRNRNFWDMHSGGIEGTKPIRATPEAFDRWLDFVDDVNKAAENTVYAEIIGTTAERTTITVLKLATILAMHECKQIVELKHVVKAISYSNAWFENAVTMASMVSESEWKREVDQLEAFINQKGGKVAERIAYRAFSTKRPFEFQEMVQSLTDRGSITRTREGSGYVLRTEYGD